MRKKFNTFLAFTLGISILLSPVSLLAADIDTSKVESTETVNTQVDSTDSAPSSVSVGDASLAVTSWADYHFEDYPKPKDNVKLAYDDNFSLSVESYDMSADDISIKYSSDSLIFELPSGSYKILSYYDNVIYAKGYKSITFSDEETGETKNSSIVELKSYTDLSTDLSTILSSVEITGEDSDYYRTCTNTDGYVLFFSSNATSIDDLQFVCKISELANYLEHRDVVDTSVKPNSDASYSISLVKKNYDSCNNCTSATYKISYDLGSLTLNDVSYDEKAINLVVDNRFIYSLNNKSSGSVNITMKGLENKTYNYYILTTNDTKYTGTFTVDFVTQSDDKQVTTSDETPTVTFTGQPSDKVNLGDSVTLTMHTDNVESQMTFNGDLLGDGNYAKSYEFNVTENGTYYYMAVSSGGKVVNGTLVVDYFDETVTDDLEDPLNMALTDATGVSDTLVQTGLNFSTYLIILAILSLVTGSVVLLDRKYHFIKFIGGKLNENK